MELESRLAGLDAEHLAPVAQNALHDPSAWPLTWDHQPLGASLVNPATAGLFYRSGAALQIALFLGCDVLDLCGHGAEADRDDSERQPWPHDLADRLGISVHDAVLGWARALVHLLDMGDDEARRLAEQVG